MVVLNESVRQPECFELVLAKGLHEETAAVLKGPGNKDHDISQFPCLNSNFHLIVLSNSRVRRDWSLLVEHRQRSTRLQRFLVTFSPDRLDNTDRCLTVPKLRHSAFSAGCQLPPNGSTNSLSRDACQNVRTGLGRHRPFSIFADRDTRNTQASGLFLDATGIGNNQRGITHEAQKIKVPQGLCDPDSIQSAPGIRTTVLV